MLGNVTANTVAPTKLIVETFDVASVPSGKTTRPNSPRRKVDNPENAPLIPQSENTKGTVGRSNSIEIVYTNDKKREPETKGDENVKLLNKEESGKVTTSVTGVPAPVTQAPPKPVGRPGTVQIQVAPQPREPEVGCSPDISWEDVCECVCCCCYVLGCVLETIGEALDR